MDTNEDINRSSDESSDGTDQQNRSARNSDQAEEPTPEEPTPEEPTPEEPTPEERRTICEQCCRTDNWNWECDHDTEKEVHGIARLRLTKGDFISEIIIRELGGNLEMFELVETSDFKPPACKKCEKDDGWFCADWHTFPNEDYKTIHWCLCGDRTIMEFPANLTPRLVNPDPTKTFIRSDFCGTWPELDHVLHSMKVSYFLCDYPDCDAKIKVLRYYTNDRIAEIFKDGIELKSGGMHPGRKTNLVFLYLLEGSCRITDSGYGPYHRLDFCEEHKEEGNQPNKTLIVMDYRDVGPEGSDHLLKYQAEMRKHLAEMTPVQEDEGFQESQNDQSEDSAENSDTKKEGKKKRWFGVF